MTSSDKESATTGLAQKVARQADVSLMTVSRVFSGSPKVSEATRRRVMEIATALGYRPNSSAQALRRGRSDTIAFLVAYPGGICGSFHSETLAALESVVSQRDFSVSIGIAPSEEGLADLITRMTASNKCCGLILRFDRFPASELKKLRGLRVPILLAMYPENAEGLSDRIGFVGYDNRLGIAQAVRHLHSLGHQRIAYIGGTPGWVDAVHREEGFRSAMKAAGLVIDETMIRSADFAKGHDLGAEAMDSIFAKASPQPTAVVCACDEIATGAVRCARRWGRHVPNDFSVIGFDDSIWCRYFSPELTSVRHSGWPLGEKLGEELLAHLDDPKLPPSRIALETSLVVRESTGRAKS